MGSITITPPDFGKLTVTLDTHGGGINDAGVAYATFDIATPATPARPYGTQLASITIYADDTIPPLVWDRYTGDARATDLRAIQVVRDVLARDYPHAQANSYRYTVV